MQPGAQVKRFARERAEVVISAFRVRTSDTRHAFGIITAFAKLTDDPLDPFESVITVGLAVLLLVLRNKLLVMAVHNFVEHSTAARTVWLNVYARFQRVCRAHTLEYRPSVPNAFRETPSDVLGKTPVVPIVSVQYFSACCLLLFLPFRNSR